MNIILDLFLISIIVVIIVDISGFIDNVKKILSYIITKGKIVKDDWNLPLFGCSLCLTWWCCFFYLIFTSNLNIKFICLSLIISIFTSTIKNLLYTLKNIIDSLINKINNLLC